MLRGKFFAQDDLDLAGHRLLNWQWLNDIPTSGAEAGQVLSYVDGSVTWAAAINSLSAGTGIAVSSSVGDVQVSNTMTWGTLPDKPEEFAPADHTHDSGEVIDFPDDLVNTISTSGALSANTSTGNVTLTNTMTWGTLPDKPAVFTPDTHTHTVADVTNFPDTWAWTDLTGVPGLVNTISTSGALLANTSTGNVTLTNTMTWGTLPDKPTFVNSASGGTNVNVSTSTGDVVISAPNAITALTAGTYINVTGATISVDSTSVATAGHTHTTGDISDFPTNLVNTISTSGALLASTSTGNVTLTNTMTWTTLPNKPTFVNDVTAGANIEISGTTGSVTIAVTSAPTFAGNLTAASFFTGAAIVAGGALTAANVRSNNNIYANYNGPDGDSNLYFYDGGSSTGAYLQWDDSAGRFRFSTTIYVNNDIIAADDIVAVGNIQSQSDMQARGNVYVNQNGPDGDSYLYFYENSSDTGAYLQWNDTAGAFDFSHELRVNGATVLLEAVESVTAGTGIALSSTTGDVTIAVTLSAGTYININGATIAVDSTSVASAAHTHAISDVTDVGTNLQRFSVNVMMDGIGAVLAEGTEAYARLNCDCTLERVSAFLDESDSITFTIDTATYSGHVGSYTDITGGSDFSISGAQTTQDTTLSGWTTSFSRGDMLQFGISSVGPPADATRALIVLDFVKDWE